MKALFTTTAIALGGGNLQYVSIDADSG